MLWPSVFVLTLAGAAAWRVFGGYGGARPGALLSRRELACLATIAEAIFPSGGAIEPSGIEAGVPAYVDRFVAASHPRQRLLMRLLFFLIEHGTLVFPAGGRALAGFRRFSAQDLEARVAILEGWRTSRLFARRLVFASLRAIVTIAYFADPAVLRSLKLSPLAMSTPVCEADLLYPRIGESRETIALSRDDLTPPSDGTPLDLSGPLLAGYDEERP